MEIKAMKREYQMQQWKRIFQERQESGLTVKAWCTEREISEKLLLLPSEEMLLAGHCKILYDEIKSIR